MQNSCKLTFLFLLFIIFPAGAGAQLSEKFTEALASYRDDAPEHIYLHLDKTSYAPGEMVWFSAYVLGDIDSMQNTLFVGLQEPGSDSLVLTSRFIMQQGFAKGCLQLPESVNPGVLRLFTYTNTLLQYPDKPLPARFIRIESGPEKSWQLHELTSPANSSPTSGRQVAYELRQSGQTVVKATTISYRITDGACLITSGKTKTTNAGNFTITLPDSVAERTLQLYTTVGNRGEQRHLSATISPQPSIVVKLFPESGELLENQACQVAFELRTKTALPSTLQGAVLENGVPIADLQFHDPASGTFVITPQKDAVYTLKLHTTLGYTCNFPPVKNTGYTISIEEGAVTDSLKLQLHSSYTSNNLQLVLHDYRDVLRGYNVVFSGNTQSVNLKRESSWEGLIAVTLIDSSDNPVAERHIFARPANSSSVNISTDSALYHSRSQGHLKVKITNAAGDPVKGLFSLGIVHAAAYDSLWMPDLPGYYYAAQHQPGNELMPSWPHLDDKAIDILLLTRFWTRFTPKKMDKKDIAALLVAKGISGNITYKDKPLKAPADLLLSAGENTIPLVTDSGGNFSLRFDQLYGPYGSRIFLTPVGTKKRYRYVHDFKTNTNAALLNDLTLRLAARLEGLPPEAPAEPGSGSEAELQSLYRVNRLQEVNISAEREPEIERLKQQYNKAGDNIFVGDCRTDYVCAFHQSVRGYSGVLWLNCPFHTNGLKPVDGMYYLNINRSKKNKMRGFVMYIGCPDTTLGKYATLLDATWQSREFYDADPEAQSEPGYIPSTTVFWSHRIVTDEKGIAEIPFFTNDITGKYLVHLQGFTANGPISGKYYYRVTGD